MNYVIGTPWKVPQPAPFNQALRCPLLLSYRFSDWLFVFRLETYDCHCNGLFHTIVKIKEGCLRQIYEEFLWSQLCGVSSAIFWFLSVSVCVGDDTACDARAGGSHTRHVMGCFVCCIRSSSNSAFWVYYVSCDQFCAITKILFFPMMRLWRPTYWLDLFIYNGVSLLISFV